MAEKEDSLVRLFQSVGKIDNRTGNEVNLARFVEQFLHERGLVYYSHPTKWGIYSRILIQPKTVELDSNNNNNNNYKNENSNSTDYEGILLAAHLDSEGTRCSESYFSE